jgi:hypothetical protein
MQYVELGRSGLWVSRLCLGTINFVQTSEQDSYAIMNRGLSAYPVVGATVACTAWHSLGGDLAGDGTTRTPGQDHLRG